MKDSLFFEKISNKEPLLIGVVIFLLSFSMVSNMLFTGIAVSAFYWCCYIAIGYVAIKKNKILVKTNNFRWFAISLFVFGIFHCIWSLYIHHYYPIETPQGMDTVNQYFLIGKRMILGAILISWIYTNQNKISKSVIYIAKATLFLGVLGVIYTGSKEYFFITHERIKLTADAASSSSYMLLALMSAYLWLSITLKNNKFFIIDIISIAIFAYLISLTGTRIAMIAYIFLTISYFFYTVKFNNTKKIAIFSMLFVIFSATLIIINAHRFDEIKSDIDSYSNNSSTSIGARFTIWKSGLSTLNNPLGFQSPDTRTQQARKYISENDPKNNEAYNNVKYNMHNEFLETLTLQGLLGLVVLVQIYLVAILGYLRKKQMAGVILPLAMLFISGLTDSVFIYPPTAMLYIMALAICSINKKSINNN
jgi:O-antigen ligase